MAIFKRTGSPYYYTECDHKGRRIVRSTRTTSAREALAFERRLRDQVAREVRETPVTPSLTLDQACARYWKEHGVKMRWALAIERHLRFICRHLDKDMPLSQLSNKDVTRLIAARHADGAGAAGTNRTLAILQGVLSRAAERWEEPVKAIAWRQHKLKEPKGRVRWITPEEAQRLIAALPPRAALMVRFFLLTGLRKSEVLNLTWGDVHFDRQSVEVTVKGGHRRVVALSPDAMLVLQEAPRTGRYVFEATNFRKLFTDGLAAVGIADFRVHDLRHTHATWLRQRGAPIEVVSRSLGHSSLAVTMRYAHVAQVEVRDALAKLPTLTSGDVVPLKRGMK